MDVEDEGHKDGEGMLSAEMSQEEGSEVMQEDEGLRPEDAVDENSDSDFDLSELFELLQGVKVKLVSTATMDHMIFGTQEAERSRHIVSI